MPTSVGRVSCPAEREWGGGVRAPWSDEVGSAVGGTDHRAPRRRGRRGWLAGLVALTMAVAFSACSSLPLGLSGSSTNNIVSSVISAVGTSTSDVSVQMSLGAGQLLKVNESGSGTMNISQGAMQLNTNTSIFGLSSPGELLLDGGVVYSKVPFAAMLFTLGKPWVSINLASLGASPAEVSTVLALIWDVPSLLKLLGSSANVVSTIGTSTIDGRPATGYDIALPASLIDSMIPSCLANTASSLGINTAKMTLSIETYVYQGSNQLARLVADVSVPDNLVGSLSANSTITFNGYGTTTAINPPSSSQVDDLTSLLKGATSGVCQSSTGTSSSSTSGASS